jgi:hypothetical protein
LSAGVVPADADLPPGFTQPAPDAGLHEAADTIAASAVILAAWLDQALNLTKTPHDQDACHDAAAAARQIHELMTADDTHAR